MTAPRLSPQGVIYLRPSRQEDRMTAPRLSPQGVTLLKTSSSGGLHDRPEAISSRRHSIEDLLNRRMIQSPKGDASRDNLRSSSKKGQHHRREDISSERHFPRSY